jgi:hypothetical protein
MITDLHEYRLQFARAKYKSCSNPAHALLHWWDYEARIEICHVCNWSRCANGKPGHIGNYCPEDQELIREQLAKVGTIV